MVDLCQNWQVEPFTSLMKPSNSLLLSEWRHAARATF